MSNQPILISLGGVEIGGLANQAYDKLAYVCYQVR